MDKNLKLWDGRGKFYFWEEIKKRKFLVVLSKYRRNNVFIKEI